MPPKSVTVACYGLTGVEARGRQHQHRWVSRFRKGCFYRDLEFRMKRQAHIQLSSRGELSASGDLKTLSGILDRPGVVAVYLSGSRATGKTTPLSDIDLAYLGTDRETEERLFDPLYEALQDLLGEGDFDSHPPASSTSTAAISCCYRGDAVD